MTKTKKSVPASVHQRLLNKAKEAGLPFNELLQRYGMERFLYRLSISDHARKFILKGALMLLAWRSSQTRPTMDMDFLSFTDNSLENLESIVRGICGLAVPQEDGLRFDTETVSAVRIKEDAVYEGVHVTFAGFLGTARIPMQIDVSFNDAVTPAPQDISYPVILDLPAPELRGYNRESMIAEKFEAMVKLGELNSRMKDFFDIWLLSGQFSFSFREIAAAIKRTFARRGTDLVGIPVLLEEGFEGLDNKQKQWAAFLRKSRIDYAPEAFSVVAGRIREFVGPVVSNLLESENIDAIWTPPGPWIENEKQ